MLQELQRARWLDQETAAWHLMKADKSLVGYNDAGNLAIDKRVLAAFKKLLPDDIVWSRGQRHWRFRERGDAPGRNQY